MKKLNNLTREELLNVLIEYDKYIQLANEEDFYVNDWKPVSISEFFDNEYQEIED